MDICKGPAVKDDIFCVYCDLSFEHPQKLQSHLTGGCEKNKDRACFYCDEKFNSAGELVQHLNSGCEANTSVDCVCMHCNTNFLQYICIICGKSFVDNQRLNEHKRIHNREDNMVQ